MVRLERCAPTTHGLTDKAGVLQRGDRRSHHHAPVSPRAYAPVAPHLLRGAEAPHGYEAVTPDEEARRGLHRGSPHAPGARGCQWPVAERGAQRPTPPAGLRQLVDDGPPGMAAPCGNDTSTHDDHCCSRATAARVGNTGPDGSASASSVAHAHHHLHRRRGHRGDRRDRPRPEVLQHLGQRGGGPEGLGGLSARAAGRVTASGGEGRR